MKEKNKNHLKNLFSFITASVVMGTSISGIMDLSKSNKKEEKKDSNKPRMYISFKTDDNENSFSSDAEILTALLNNNNETEDETIIEEEENISSKEEENNTTKTKEIEIVEEELDEREQVLNDLNIDLSHLEEMANILGEELIIHSNPRYIENVSEYIYDINNDNIDKNYKIEYIRNLYNIDLNDIYLLTEIFGEAINENPTVSPYETIKNVLSCVLNNQELKELENDFCTQYKLNTAIVTEEAERYYNDYINNNVGTCYRLVINSLFYKLFNLPLEWKLDYIYNRWDISQKELEIIIKCMLCEAAHHSYLDTYFVTNVLINRTYSKKWIVNYGNNVYDQLIRPGQFEVYNRGDYHIYDNMNLDDLLTLHEESIAVIDCLVEGGIATTASNFWGNGYEAKDKLETVENGNNFFNENGQMSEEDLCATEDRYPIINYTVLQKEDTVYTLKK